MALKQKNHTTDKLTILAILSVVFLFGTSAFSGTGKTAPKSVTFPVKISKDKRYFTDSNNRPFFYQACTGWELLSKLTREETEMYRKNRAEKGFNTIQVTLLPWEVDQVNRYREPAFIDKKPFGQPNEKYFEHVDWVLQKAKELGIQLGINVFWLRNNWREYTTVENVRTFGDNMGYCYDPFHCARIDPYAHVQFIHAWNLKPVKPVILGESFYEEANYTFKNNDEQLYAVRRNPLWAIT